ncbi:hypothetical protein [Thalassomonas actiniarum]|uniref:Uncharacterized protein n=1 Tax=Thalassomonas actiniarum TaxID=485447 RepID=A0AAF0C1W1_9GAMM|nr:hypothetical protein [Thalassomonas actiniarum]WDD97358.1 hypothetical protein SG35_018760 [Thalassomonas actiniarum]
MKLKGWVMLLLSLALFANAGAGLTTGKHMHKAEEEEPAEQHKFSKANRYDFDGEQYWYYKMMEKVTNESVTNGTLLGEIQERDRKIYFQLPKTEADNAGKRNKGYTMAVAKIVAFLEPGFLPDNDANKQYMANLKKILQKNTQLSKRILEDHSRLSLWFSRNKNRLIWSEQAQQLVIAELK